MPTVNNIRFPHRCTIYETSGVTPFSEGVKTVVWSGRCRKENRTYGVREDVPKTSYRVQLGAVVGGDLPGDRDAAYGDRSGMEVGARVQGIRAGMLIDVTDCQDSFTGKTVSDAYCGNLGTSVFFGESKT